MKTFKKFTNDTKLVIENPLINTYLSKDRLNRLAQDKRQLIKDSPSPEETIDHNFYHKKINDDHVYYNKNSNNEVNAFSIVSNDNVHKLTHKNNDDSHQIHLFMTHHAEKHGFIQSDESNTEGSKNLWTTLIKSKPVNKTFHVINAHRQEKFLVSSDNIDDVSDKIWGKHSRFNNIRLVMTHHDT